MAWFGLIKGNKIYKVGPFNAENDCRRVCLQAGCEYSVYNLPTRDLARAGQMMRAQMLGGGASIDDISKRHYKTDTDLYKKHHRT